MKKQIKLLSLILALVFSVAALLIFRQYDNISALINGLNYSTEDLAQKMDENRANLKAEVESILLNLELI